MLTVDNALQYIAYVVPQCSELLGYLETYNMKPYTVACVCKLSALNLSKMYILIKILHSTLLYLSTVCFGSTYLSC